MKTFNICVSTNTANSINFDKVEIEDIAEIIKLMVKYYDVTSITVNQTY